MPGAGGPSCDGGSGARAVHVLCSQSYVSICTFLGALRATAYQQRMSVCFVCGCVGPAVSLVTREPGHQSDDPVFERAGGLIPTGGECGVPRPSLLPSLLFWGCMGVQEWLPLKCLVVPYPLIQNS